jgi:CO/xanthine dehydrogenase Mo-binding subunit
MEKPQFVDDIFIKDVLTGILLRSPVVCGFIDEIKTPELPSDAHLIGFTNIPGNKTVSFEQTGGNSENKNAHFGAEIPIFPEKELFWYGQPVALLLGPEPEVIRELAEQSAVLASEIYLNQPTERTVIVERTYTTGNTDDIFEKADLVVEGNYTTGIQAPWSSDPLGVIAVPGPDKSMTIYAASQWPGHIRYAVAQCLNIKPANVKVKFCRLESHMDGKLVSPSLFACQAAVAAFTLNKPVKIILKRNENFLFSSKSIRAGIYIQSAVNKHGHILASKVQISADFGAIGTFTNEILDRIALGALGAYNHGAIDLNARGFSSNLPTAGPITGFGFTQGFFACEMHVSRIADTVGIDPAEWRKLNYLRKGKKLAIGAEIKDTFREEIIDTARAMSGYQRKWAAYELLRTNRRKAAASEYSINEPLRGIGIAFSYQGYSFLYDYRPLLSKSPEESVLLTLEKDGSLEIRTNYPWGINQLTCWETLAEKILGVKKVRVLLQSQDALRPVPETGPACLSRGIGIVTPLIEKACKTIAKQRFRDPLPITIERKYRMSKAPAWGKQDQCYDQNSLDSLGWGCAVVETEIDTVTYSPRIRGVWLAIDGGTIIAEDRAQKNIHNTAMNALSWAMHEKIRYKDGKIDSGVAINYPIPGIEESPNIFIEFIKSEGASKAIGGLPFSIIPAAYVQALSQALDYPFESYPIHTADIWMAFLNRAMTGAEK